MHRRIRKLSPNRLSTRAALSDAAIESWRNDAGNQWADCSFSERRPGYQIYTLCQNGYDLRQITHVNGDAISSDWSPDDDASSSNMTRTTRMSAQTPRS